MSTETKEIIDELHSIKEELHYIKENMVNKDMLLSSEEKELLEQSYKNEKEDKLISQEELEKELGL